MTKKHNMVQVKMSVDNMIAIVSGNLIIHTGASTMMTVSIGPTYIEAIT